MKYQEENNLIELNKLKNKLINYKTGRNKIIRKNNSLKNNKRNKKKIKIMSILNLKLMEENKILHNK